MNVPDRSRNWDLADQFPQVVDRTGTIYMPEGDIILSAGHLVGAGDHFIYSTLAKRFHELGRKVYLYRITCARNTEILDMVWGRNPYIIGTTDRAPNAGYVRQGLFYEVANRLPGHRAIEAMERAHGLPPPYSLAPWVNYTPKKYHIDLSGAILIDFSAVSSKISDQGIGEHLRAMKGRYRNAPFVQLIPPKFASLHPPQIRCESIQLPSEGSIYAYFDALASCRAWVGSEAGGQSFAAAVRGEYDVYDLDARPEIVCVMTPQTENDGGYTYRTTEYRTTVFGQDRSTDYHWPIEMANHVYNIRCEWSLEQMRSENPDAWKPIPA